MRHNKLIAAGLAVITAISLMACGSAESSTQQTSETTTTETASDDTQNTETALSDAAETMGWADGSTVYVDVPAKAGGGTDLYTRYLTAALQEVCPNVNFVVTNYDTEEVGMQHAKNADGDGLTLLTCHGGAILKYFTGASDVSLKDDMKVVGIMNLGGPQAIITNPDAPYTNFEELAAYIQEHQGEVVVGCSLGGTTQVLFTKLIDELTDGHPEYVNYVQCSSEADKLTNVASNAINIANCSMVKSRFLQDIC